jgi:protein required for attachment to host cells
LNIMNKTWVLITDAARARCYERNAADHTLQELVEFVHPPASPRGQSGGGDLTGEAGKGHGRTGHAGTQFEPHTEAHAKERASFARELADHLNKGVAEQRCQALVLIATSPMLGELRTHLSHASEKIVLASIASDLTHYSGRELETRVTDGLSAR